MTNIKLTLLGFLPVCLFLGITFLLAYFENALNIALILVAVFVFLVLCRSVGWLVNDFWRDYKWKKKR